MNERLQGVKAMSADSLKDIEAFDTVCREMREDLEWAWTWYCNIKMMMVDVGVPPHNAAQRARTFMQQVFSVDITQCEHWAEELTESDVEITEKQRRLYYQDIVYKVCSFTDSKIGGITVCGTFTNSQNNIMDRLALLVPAVEPGVVPCEEKENGEWRVVDQPAEPEKQPQHTPGPWGVEQTQTTNWIGPLRADGKVDRIVAQNDRHNLTPAALAERDANARLIAQAPSFESTIEECLKPRDEAEAVADELASLVLDEPVDWAFHEGRHVVQEKQPQPGWVINEFRDIGWRTIGPGGYVIVLNEDYEEFRGAYDLTWEDLPNCTGWDYKIPPEETPAERRLREVGLKEHNGDYLKPTGKAGVTYSISWRHWTAEQVEAIAAHMREREGGAE